MPQYMLSVYMDPDNLPTEEQMQGAYKDVDALNAEMMATNTWVFGCGLHPAEVATVVQAKGDDVLVTDGPFGEAKEHVGGFWIIKADDLDGALDWAKRATVACLGAVEVRPLQDEPEA